MPRAAAATARAARWPARPRAPARTAGPTSAAVYLWGRATCDARRRFLAEVALDRDDVLQVLHAAEDARELADRGDLERGSHDGGVVRPDGDIRGEDVDLRLRHDLGDVA